MTLYLKFPVTDTQLRDDYFSLVGEEIQNGVIENKELTHCLIGSSRLIMEQFYMLKVDHHSITVSESFPSDWVFREATQEDIDAVMSN